MLGTALRWADSLCPLPQSPPDPFKEPLPDINVIHLEEEPEFGLPWMSRVSASCSSCKVMVPLPSESNRAKNRSAKKDCGHRRAEKGTSVAAGPGL